MLSQSVEHNTATPSKIKFTNYKQCFKSSERQLILYGNVAIILGISLIMFQTTIMSFIAEKVLNLNSNSPVFKIWQKYPMKIPNAITFFNWTNHNDFFNRSVKPKFEEIGPYTFLQELEKVDVVRNDNNNTITFKQRRTYEYDTSLPNNGNLSDRLITINYFSMFTGHFIRDWDNVVKDVFSEYASLFDPYYYFDTIVDNEVLKGTNNLFLELSNYFDFIFPDIRRLDGFGWGKLRNGDPNFDGVFNIANGENRQFDILSWNYHRATPYFKEPCNEIKGSIGDIYSFPLNKEYITIFSPEVCRYLKLYFEEEVVVDGIIGYKYSFTQLSFDNGTLNPENKCFCIGPCIPAGVIGLSSCRFSLNGYASLPHYYNADPIYLDAFEGLKPEKEKHESYIVVEPNSLLCLKFKIAAQLNVFLYPVEGISFFDDFPKVYFPLLWMDMFVELPSELMKYLKLYLCVPYVLIAIGDILIALGIFVTCYGLYKLKKSCSLERSQSKDPDFMENTPLNVK